MVMAALLLAAGNGMRPQLIPPVTWFAKGWGRARCVVAGPWWWQRRFWRRETAYARGEHPPLLGSPKGGSLPGVLNPSNRTTFFDA